MPCSPLKQSERQLPRAIRIACLSMTLAAALPTMCAYAVAAEPAPQAYQLAAGPLGRTLSGVAASAGLALSFDPALTAGLNSPALYGSYAPRAALERLLSGSGLALVSRADGTLTLQKQTAPAAAPRPAAQAVAAAPTTATLTQVEVHGQAGDADTSPGKTRATSATRLDLSLRETPQAISIINSQRIEDQRLDTLQDVVAQSTGITLDHASTTRENDQLFSRGFAIDTYLFDGLPTSRLIEPTGFDAAIYERVEVLRGAAGLISGTGSPAASVNLVRKRPTRELHADAEVQAGNWQRYRAQTDISGPVNDAKSVRARVVLAEQNQHSFVSRYQQKKELFYGIVEADLSPSTLLTAGLSYQDERLDAASRRFVSFYSDGTQTDFDRATNSASNASYYDRQQTVAFISMEHFFDNDWSAKASLTYASNLYDAVQGYAMRGQLDKASGAGLSLWQTKWNYKPTQYSLDAYLSGPFQAFGRQHDAAFGVSASDMEGSGPAYPSWVLPGYDTTVANFYTWNGNSPTPDYSGKIIGSSSEKEKQLAAYGTVRLRPADDVSVILGARATNWKRDTDSLEYGSPVIDDHFEYNGKITPYAGLVYQLSPDWSAYASYTSIFSPQTYRNRSNALLPPLEGNNNEIGLKGDFLNGQLSTSVSLYRMKQDNLAEMDADEFWLPSGAGSYAYHTVQGAIAKGIELEVSGKIERGWQLTAGYAHGHVEDSSGARLQTIQPLNSFKLWTSYEVPGLAHGLTVGGGLNWQSKVYQDNAGPQGQRFTQDGYALLSLMARWRITRQLSATANVNNVTDKKYYSSGSGGFYGDPRNVMLSLDYRFR